MKTPWSPRHSKDYSPPTPETASVDGLLTRVGGAYRSQAIDRRLSPRAAERIQRSLLAAARPAEDSPADFGARRLVEWLRAFSRPLVYGMLGAAAVFVWSVWVQPARSLDAQLLFAAETELDRLGPDPRSLKRGQTVIARGAHGAVVQVGEHSQVFLRPDTVVELVSNKVLALRTGELWVYHAGKSGNLTVLTPQGRVTPIGTVFGVRSGPASSGGLRVEVLEGAVRVARGETVATVPSAHSLDWAFSSQEAVISPAPVAVPTWTEELIDAYRREFFQRYFPSMEPRRFR